MPDIKLLREKRLAEIDARAYAASKGDWKVEYDGDLFELIPPFALYKIYSEEGHMVEFFSSREDAEFCANARQDVPWMSARIKELEAEVSSARKWARRWKKAAKMNGSAAHRWKESAREKHNLIAALMEAARSCETCIWFMKEDSEGFRCTRCRDSGKKYGRWIFDTRRYAPKGAEQ